MKCRQATRLISDGQDRDLGLREQAALGLHLAACVNCRRFQQQVGVVRQASRRLAELEAPGRLDDGPVTPPEDDAGKG